VALSLKFNARKLIYKFKSIIIMATKTSGSAEPTEKINDSIFKSKNSASPKSGKESLKKIFEELLQDTYSAEKQLIKALPDLAKAAYNEDLQEAFETHLKETEKQAQRLEKIFDRLHVEKEGESPCKAMEGLIKESQELIKEHQAGNSRDAALIIAAQKVEHYEIASYGSLVELADVLGLDGIADLLERTLEEEKITDELLSDIAQDVNDEAYEERPAEFEYN
jgi:ferritin-like metal-binding protein YciE